MQAISPKSLLLPFVQPIVHFVAMHFWLLLTIMGAIVILLAFVTFLMDQRLSDLFVWLQQVFGWGFALVYGVLLSAGIFAWHQLCIGQGHGGGNADYWFEFGQQAAGGIATLSLTFTLLGISLGIGSLTDKVIDPQTIQGIIQDLTKHFSTAFMTTVVGLPTANILRAAIVLRHVKQHVRQQKLRNEKAEV